MEVCPPSSSTWALVCVVFLRNFSAGLNADGEDENHMEVTRVDVGEVGPSKFGERELKGESTEDDGEATELSSVSNELIGGESVSVVAKFASESSFSDEGDVGDIWLGSGLGDVSGGSGAGKSNNDGIEVRDEEKIEEDGAEEEVSDEEEVNDEDDEEEEGKDEDEESKDEDEEGKDEAEVRG